MIERHRRGARWHMLFAVALAALAALTLAAGFLVLGAPNWSIVVFGGFVGALALYPYWRGLDIEDRIGGLEVLRDEWRDLERVENPSNHDFVRLRRLLGRIYDKKRAA